MSKDGGCAFPYSALTPDGPQVYGDSTGMSLRDYFAAKAMVAWIGAYNHPETRPFSRTYFPNVAIAAYELADEMLKAREA